jgi:hypothetical protein
VKHVSPRVAAVEDVVTPVSDSSAGGSGHASRILSEAAESTEK